MWKRRVKYPLFLSDFSKTWISSTDFRKKLKKITISIKIHPVGDELFHEDTQTEGQTDRHDEANSRFSQFCERA